MINVTKTFLPPIEEYNKYLEKIWQSGWVTNHGPLVLELEEKLKKYFDIKHLFFVTNGTIALQIAIKALDLKGEIITTPFSYVATTSSIVWEGCTPVFVDIDPLTLTINPELIEDAITENTGAILATHVYGYPCHIERIEEIATKHNLKIIYDAAHAFGAVYKNKQLATYGDVSTLSFHATKLFHTIEGGAILTDNDEIAYKTEYMRRFGHHGPNEFWGLGINGKNSEFHAAMGLSIFPYVKENISKRQNLVEYYKARINCEELKLIEYNDDDDYLKNYAYFPVLFQSKELLEFTLSFLNTYQIFPRRYFFPSLNKLNYVSSQGMPTSEDISERVLCLPLYEDLSLEEIDLIVDYLLKSVTRWMHQYS